MTNELEIIRSKSFNIKEQKPILFVELHCRICIYPFMKHCIGVDISEDPCDASDVVQNPDGLKGRSSKRRGPKGPLKKWPHSKIVKQHQKKIRFGFDTSIFVVCKALKHGARSHDLHTDGDHCLRQLVSLLSSSLRQQNGHQDAHDS